MPVATSLAAACIGCKDSGRGAPVSAPPASEDRTAPAAESAQRGGQRCVQQPFTDSVDLAEASGAVWVEPSFGLPAHLVVVSDSGGGGAFAVVDAASGVQLGSGRLPLDQVTGDDFEGLSRIGRRYVAITSSGFVRHYRRTDATGFDLEEPAYGLGAEVQCQSPTASNCGFDFEGLCVQKASLDREDCAGYAASRSRGQLICLRFGAGDHLIADPARAIELGWRGRLAGCTIDPGGDRLYAGANLLGGNAVVEIDGWRQPETARPGLLGSVGIGFAEAIAAGPGAQLYRFSDTGGRPSGQSRHVCAGASDGP